MNNTDTSISDRGVRAHNAPALTMADMPLRWGHIRIVINGSMEQLVGAGLSAIAGIIIPLMLIAGYPGMSSFLQGVIGAAGLTGIAVGSAVIGRLSDRYGYLFYFRLCPVLIMVGSMLGWLWPSPATLAGGLFIAGIGLGGGYTLDTDYISELMPRKWSLFMCGVAKSTSALGFIAYAGAAWWLLSDGLGAERWPDLLLLLAGMGALTFLMRIPFRNSPRWLMAHGMKSKAEAAARYFFGNDVTIEPLPAKATGRPVALSQLFRGEMLRKVIYTGVPWACEGVGVYGVGVFLPALVMALGLDRTNAVGLAKVINSVEFTTIINCFILPGFLLGLCLLRRMSHGKMLTYGFWGATAGLSLLLLAYLLHWPIWVSVVGFLIFEMMLNGGPHLVTFILPAQVYDVSNRGLGDGVAAMTGKIGAILGVFFMPVLLDKGGITLVLAVCIGVNILGAAISALLGPKVLSEASEQNKPQ